MAPEHYQGAHPGAMPECPELVKLPLRARGVVPLALPLCWIEGLVGSILSRFRAERRAWSANAAWAWREQALGRRDDALYKFACRWDVVDQGTRPAGDDPNLHRVRE